MSHPCSQRFDPQVTRDPRSRSPRTCRKLKVQRLLVSLQLSCKRRSIRVYLICCFYSELIRASVLWSSAGLKMRLLSYTADRQSDVDMKKSHVTVTGFISAVLVFQVSSQTPIIRTASSRTSESEGSDIQPHRSHFTTCFALLRLVGSL